MQADDTASLELARLVANTHPLVGPLQEFKRYARECLSVLNLAIAGIARTSAMVPLAEALIPFEELVPGGEDKEEASKKLEQTRSAAALAKSEVANEFPLLHAHMLIGIWSALEAAIEDCLVIAVQADPDVRAHPQVARVRLSYGDVLELTAEELARKLVFEIQRNLGAEQKLGVGGFESLLDLVGASGCADDAMRRTLLEFQQYRHVIVHRAGIADRALVERCSWLALRVGDRINIGHRTFHALVLAAAEYVNRIHECLLKRYRRNT